MNYKTAILIKKNYGIDLIKIGKDLLLKALEVLTVKKQLEDKNMDEQLITLQSTVIISQVIDEYIEGVDIENILKINSLIFDRKIDLDLEKEEDFDAIELEVLNFKEFIAEKVLKASTEFAKIVDDKNFQFPPITK